MPQGEAWTRIKQEIAPSTKRLVKEHRDEFFRYVAERYQIYLRRQLGAKPPWTKDPILQRNHFTNVFRMHDKGTMWLVGQIMPHLRRGTYSNEQVIWLVVQYRFPNYPALFEDWGWIPRGFNPDLWLRRIEKTKKTRGQWHTNAHIVLQSNFKQSRAHNYMQYLKGIDENFEEFSRGILEATGMQEAFKHVKKFQGFGGFTAYEILIDLCYLGVLPDSYRDEFANAGPGAEQGIELIYPDTKKTPYTKAMEKLRDQQVRAFQRLNLPATPHLTLQDIEFSLCEFSKYMKIKHGTGKSRLYKPKGEYAAVRYRRRVGKKGKSRSKKVSR